MNRTEHHATSEPTTRATRHALDQRGSPQPATSHELTEGSTPGTKDAAVSKVEIPQYRRLGDPCDLGGRGPTDGGAGVAGRAGGRRSVLGRGQPAAW